jgi:hypothetical protein
MNGTMNEPNPIIATMYRSNIWLKANTNAMIVPPIHIEIPTAGLYFILTNSPVSYHELIIKSLKTETERL